MGEAAWIEKLRRAALPGAARVTFSKSVRPEENAVSFELRSLNAAGKALGDDRDYDLLKAVIVPLERLAEANPNGVRVELDIATGALRLTPLD